MERHRLSFTEEDSYGKYPIGILYVYFFLYVCVYIYECIYSIDKLQPAFCLSQGDECDIEDLNFTHTSLLLYTFTLK